MRMREKIFVLVRELTMETRRWSIELLSTKTTIGESARWFHNEELKCGRAESQNCCRMLGYNE